jgi:predicted dehydrogenase
VEDTRNILSAVVGTGFIGPVHVEALRRLGRPVVGVLGSTPERGRAAAEAMRVRLAYHTFEQLVADPTVSVVHLASPNRLHFEQCRQVLAAGKHVICEKPLAMTSDQTAELVELANRSAVISAVNYNIRFYPLCLEARERVRAGDLGEIYHVSGSYLQDWLLYDTDFNWRVLSGEGGALRAVADIGTHWLDLVTWVTGLEIESVCADLKTLVPTRQRPRGSVETFSNKKHGITADAPNPWPWVDVEKFAGKRGGEPPRDPVAVDTEDYGAALLRFGGGAGGSFTVSQVAAGRKNGLRFEVSGSRGSLAWDSERPNELWLGHRDQANEVLTRDPALLRVGARRFANYPGGHNEGFPDTFKQLFRAVYEYIEAGDWTAPRPFPTFADGHREALLCDAILTSHREGRWADVENSSKGERS